MPIFDGRNFLSENALVHRIFEMMYNGSMALRSGNILSLMDIFGRMFVDKLTEMRKFNTI